MKKRERIKILERRGCELERRITLYRTHVCDLGRRVEILEYRVKKAEERRSYATATKVLNASARLGDVHEWLDSLPTELEAMIRRACWWRSM